MKRPHLSPFRRLQWRLTFSYTLVTVAALVVVELILLGALLVLLNSSLLQNAIVSTLRESVVPEVSSFLQATPPDLEGLNDWLSPTIQGDVGSRGISPRITPGFTIDTDQENTHIFVLDPDYRLLAQSPPPEDPTALGTVFDATRHPGLAELLPLALKSGTDVERLRSTSSDGTLLIALPATGQDGTVLGLLVATVTLPTFNQQTVGILITIILYSVVPLTLMAGVIGTIFGYLTARGLSQRLRGLARAADSWSRGDFSEVTQDDSGDELGQLSRDLNRMAERLQNLLDARQELATLEERNRLARDLHDSVKQQVFATTMQIGAAKTLLATDPEAAKRHLTDAEQLSHQSQQELAGLILELRPVALEGRGLAAALREFAADWSRRTHIRCETKVTGEQPLSLPLEQALFRVAQEALANVARHSETQSAEICLAWENDIVTLTISDDGRGFDMSEGERHGFGTKTMRERIEAHNGRLIIRSEPGKGTSVIAELPAERRGFAQ